MTSLILASSSPRRLELLAQIHIKPDAVFPADIDETPHKNELPRLFVKRIAHEKCAFVQEQYKNSYILSADTIVAVGRRILGKAENGEQAASFLKLLSGRSHRVYTAISLYNPHKNIFQSRLAESRVSFHHLDIHDINQYIKMEEWQGKAGAYAIQGYAGRFIRQITGSYTNIVGLPIDKSFNLLKGAGYFNLKDVSHV